MSKELRRTTTPPSYIRKFMEAVYPEAPNLAIASFDEEKVLTDATELIAYLRVHLEPINESGLRADIERLRSIAMNRGQRFIHILRSDGEAIERVCLAVERRLRSVKRT